MHILCYATILKITGYNLQYTLIITSILVAISVYYAAKAMYKTFGLSAGVLMIYLLFSFHFDYNGMLLKESFGLMFACLSFAFLWNGYTRQKAYPLYMGYVLFSLAMAIRPGVILAIPILAVISGLLYKPNNRFYNFKHAGLCLILLAVSFILIPRTVKSNFETITKAEKLSMAGGVLYTLAQGGDNNWRGDHPWMKRMERRELNAALMKKSIDIIKRKPHLFMESVTNSEKLLFSSFMSVCFPFDLLINKMFFIVFMVFFLCIAIYLKSALPRRLLLFLLLGIVGIIFSYPIITGGAGGVYGNSSSRVFSTVIPINCALILTGYGLLLTLLFNGPKFLSRDTKVETQSNSLVFQSGLSIALLIFIIVGPLFVKAGSPKYDFSNLNVNCSNEQVIFRKIDNCKLELVPNNQVDVPRPKIEISKFNSEIKKVKSKQNLDAKVGHFFYVVYNLSKPEDLRYKILRLNEDIKFYEGDYIVSCAKFIDKTFMEGEVLFTGDYPELVNAFSKNTVIQNEDFNNKVVWANKNKLYERADQILVKLKDLKKKDVFEATAVSKNVLPEGNNGFFEATVLETDASKKIGFVNLREPKSILHGFFLKGGKIKIILNNTVIRSFGKYNPKDVFKVERKNNEINFYQNDNLLYTEKKKSYYDIGIKVEINNKAGMFEDINCNF